MRYLAMLLLLVGCATEPNRYQAEYEAYINMLNAEMQAGRLTRPQAEYLAQQKLNQLASQQKADSANSAAETDSTINLMDRIQRSSQPRRTPY